MKFRTFLLGLAALLVAGCAAYFSVSGLSKLFAGSTLSVIIMAGSLEFAKLVSAGFIYNYWTKLNKLLKGYLTFAIVILMIITSAGIYGFLTAAYKQTSDQLNIIDKQTNVFELKKERYTEELANYNTERAQLNQSINELSKGLANNTIQYKDKETGEIITTTSSATRKVLTEQLNDFKSQRESVADKIDVLNDSITSLDLQVLDITANNELAAEVGPLRYISDMTGKSMDSVVNWFALFIVLVFDPLAVTLIIAFSSAMIIDKGERDKKSIMENNYQVYGDSGKDLTKEEESDDIVENNIYDDVDGLYDEGTSEGTNEGVNDVSYTDNKVKTDISTTEHNFDDDLDIDIPDGYDEIGKNILQSERDKEIFSKEIETPNPPNQKLKEAYDKYMKRDTDLPNVDNPKWIEYEGGGWKKRYKENEYFYHPWFDWNKADRWIHNKKAIDHWLHHQAGTLSQLQKYRDMYPDPNNTKKY